MNIRIHPEFLERLNSINWFSRIFEPDEISTSLDYIYIKSWTAARPLFRSIKWERTTNEARNALSEHVGMKFPELFDTTWNEMVIEVNPWIETYIDPVSKGIMNRYNLGENFVNCVGGQILMIIMNDIYRDTEPPGIYYSEVIKFYEAGHFPYGWRVGRWPHGTLLVA